jgi:hypothetical protein
MRRKLAKARRLTLAQWRDLMRAVVELARARAALGRVDPKQLASLSRETSQGSSVERSGLPLVARVAWAVPAAASVVPWRSDCLVQALAARRWLAAEGIATALHLGARRADGRDTRRDREARSSLEAHAWLTCGDRIVTGGDISGYVPFTPPASSSG